MATQKRPTSTGKKSGRKTQKSSPYNTAFFVRLGVLGGLLVLIAALFVIDRAVLVPNAQKSIAEMKAVEVEDATAYKSKMRELAGSEPVNIEKIGDYEVEVYRFGRVLPFLKSYHATAVYSDIRSVEFIEGKMTSDFRAELAAVGVANGASETATGDEN